MGKTHGESKTRLYRIYQSMKRRCYDPKCDSYKNYGAKGVVVCEEWMKDPMSFINWSRRNGYRDDLTIDRISGGNSPYSPDNCRWTTWKVQANNTSQNRILLIEGERLTISQFSERFGISRDVINHRLEKGWTADGILNVPVKEKSRKIIPIGGKLYSIKDAAKIIGIRPGLISSRLYGGWSPERIVEIGSKNPHIHKVEFMGETFNTIADAARRHGKSPKLVVKRIASGWSIEDSLTKESRTSKN